MSDEKAWVWKALDKQMPPISDGAIWKLLGKIDGHRAERIANFTTSNRSRFTTGESQPIALHLSNENDHAAVKFYAADLLGKERDACFAVVAEYLTDEQKALVRAAFDSRGVLAVQLSTSWSVATGAPEPEASK